MMPIQQLLEGPAGQALGWALIHFLWQGTLAALIYAAALPLLRNSSARLRYAIGCLALLVMLALPAATFAVACIPASGFSGPTLGVTVAPAPVARNMAASVVYSRASIAPMLPWIVSLWIAGIALLSLRWLGAWAWLRTLRRRGRFDIPAAWEQSWRDLLHRARVSAPVRLAIDSAIQVPCAIGWLRPVILMPAATLAGADWRTIEALLAHELAHIRRHDYLINLLQTAADTLLFYHPAVWWLSRQVRIERENCCDDIAATLCGDRILYARALIHIEELRAPRRAFAMSAGGGSLAQRIQRLLGIPGARDYHTAWLTPLAAAAIVVCLFAGWRPPVHASGPAPQPQPAEAHDFLSGIVAAGFHHLTVDELIQLKIHGVTPEFATSIKSAGYKDVTAQELVQLAIHGVDAAFVRHLQDSGLKKLSIDQLIRLKNAGI